MAVRIAHNLRTETVAGGNGDDGKLDGGQRRLLVTGAVWLEDSDQLEPEVADQLLRPARSTRREDVNRPIKVGMTRGLRHRGCG